MAMGRCRWPKSWSSWGRICWRWPVWTRPEELRQAGITLPILCLGETPVELAPTCCWSIEVTQMVEDLETGRTGCPMGSGGGERR